MDVPTRTALREPYDVRGCLAEDRMKTWRRAYPDERCGSCREPFRAGDPVLILGLKRQLPIGPAIEQFVREKDWSVAKLRCRNCAGEEPPIVLPTALEPMSVKEWHRIERPKTRGAVKDWALKAAGERE